MKPGPKPKQPVPDPGPPPESGQESPTPPRGEDEDLRWKSVNIDPGIHRELKLAAVQLNCSIQDLLHQAITTYLPKATQAVKKQSETNRYRLRKQQGRSGT